MFVWVNWGLMIVRVLGPKGCQGEQGRGLLEPMDILMFCLLRSIGFGVLGPNGQKKFRTHKDRQRMLKGKNNGKGDIVGFQGCHSLTVMEVFKGRDIRVN